ncbi:MAG: hypothetical protein IT378_17140 [Sandaracinaceae bacterium]|nr:hypothetical protein [Sandaracinaceae bacterium]
MRLRCLGLLFFSPFALGACGLTLDYDPRPDAGSFDAGSFDAGSFDAGSSTLDAGSVVRDCTGHADGTLCATDLVVIAICAGGQCEPSTCGDGIVDPRTEDCEGESAGCTSCNFVCEGDADCAIGALPECVRGFVCDLGAHSCGIDPEPDGTSCTQGSCAAGACRAPGCGDGTLDSGEECDDGNAIAGDGCEPNCMETCNSDSECDDRDPCNGVEQCASVSGGGGHVCETGSPPTLEACEICVPLLGLVRPDRDGDGFFDATRVSPACAMRDCNDSDARVFPGAVEICNGVDDNCNAGIDEGLTTVTLSCAPDRDGDGYPGSSTGTIVSCGCGESSCRCPDGTAPVQRAPGGSLLLDCFDQPGAGASVHPGQLAFFPTPYCNGMGVCSFDYNCDGTEEEALSTGVRCDLLTLRGCRGDGWQGSFPSCGEAGVYALCSPLALVCRAETETRIQQCR